MQPAGDHEVKHQPEIVPQTKCDTLADPPQFPDNLALRRVEGRLYGSKKKRICQPDLFQRLAEDSTLQSRNVGGDIGSSGILIQDASLPNDLQSLMTYLLSLLRAALRRLAYAASARASGGMPASQSVVAMTATSFAACA